MYVCFFLKKFIIFRNFFDKKVFVYDKINCSLKTRKSHVADSSQKKVILLKKKKKKLKAVIR
jgi:hypothetical protein